MRGFIGRELSEDGILNIVYDIVDTINDSNLQYLIKSEGELVYNYPQHNMKLIKWNDRLYRVKKNFVEPFYIPVRKVAGLTPLDNSHQRIVDTLKDINIGCFIVGYQLSQIRDMVSDLLVNNEMKNRNSIPIYDKICNY